MSGVEYVFVGLFLAAGMLMIGQTSGTVLMDHLGGVVARILPAEMLRPTPSYFAFVSGSGSDCQAVKPGSNGCPVRVSADVTGIPGVDARNGSRTPSFVVAASPTHR